MTHIPELVISCIIAYLLGSVSSGILVSKAVHGPDLHTVGSKSTGQQRSENARMEIRPDYILRGCTEGCPVLSDRRTADRRSHGGTPCRALLRDRP